MKYTPGVVCKVSRENSVGTHQVSACKDGSSLFLESLYSWTVASAIPFSEQVPYPIRSMHIGQTCVHNRNSGEKSLSS